MGNSSSVQDLKEKAKKGLKAVMPSKKQYGIGNNLTGNITYHVNNMINDKDKLEPGSRPTDSLAFPPTRSPSRNPYSLDDDGDDHRSSRRHHHHHHRSRSSSSPSSSSTLALTYEPDRPSRNKTKNDRQPSSSSSSSSTAKRRDSLCSCGRPACAGTSPFEPCPFLEAEDRVQSRSSNKPKPKPSQRQTRHQPSSSESEPENSEGEIESEEEEEEQKAVVKQSSKSKSKSSSSSSNAPSIRMKSPGRPSNSSRARQQNNKSCKHHQHQRNQDTADVLQLEYAPDNNSTGHRHHYQTNSERALALVDPESRSVRQVPISSLSATIMPQRATMQFDPLESPRTVTMRQRETDAKVRQQNTFDCLSPSFGGR